MRLRAAATAAFLAILAACAPLAQDVASAPAQRAGPVWAFEESDIPPDEGFRFGQLPNGMRYIVRQNATPAGTAIVRMEIEAGSLDEEVDELGFAHFVEHMAFNGSTNVPEGEMVRLLERNGLAFGADTNASTGFDRTTYKLDLPRNDTELLDVALHLMRETASELGFDPQAVEREKGVILAERRDRNTYTLRNALDDTQFLHPGARYPDRFPIGAAETIAGASADALRAFWSREYVPEHTTIVVIGDFDPDLVEARIRDTFSGWTGPAPEPQPGGGPVDPSTAGRTDVYVDPALSERITATRHGPWLDKPDTVAQRQEGLLRQIGYNIVNRRLQRLSRLTDPPFRGAGFGTGDVFEDGRSTRIIVDTADGKWKRGLEAAVQEYRRALAFGFTEAEVAEQVANIRTATENTAASADTLNHQTWEGLAFGLLREDMVPSGPRSVLERLETFIPQITPDRVLAAMKREAVPLDDPLLRFRGRTTPAGGADAIRAAWNAAMAEQLARGDAQTSSEFAYGDFGEPGKIVEDDRIEDLGIRRVRFDNNVMLNIKRTKLEKDRVLVDLTVDGGDMLNTRENPLATQMMQVFSLGGLGQHSRDELQTILAGRTIGSSVSSTAEGFTVNARTTPRDLGLQLDVLAAYLSDPGYRLEGEVQYRQNINDFFARRDATPSSALQTRIGGILSDEDPRFTILERQDYRDLTFEKLRADISERLGNGAIEIGIVGDIPEDQAIALVAHSLGALPGREASFRDYAAQQPRPFTADFSRRILRHEGPEDQALLRFTWPTTDDGDPVETITMELLERIMRIELTETLRERLGKAYSPSAASSMSRYWDGYGTFGIAASVDVREIAETRDALVDTVERLRSAPVDADLLQRARQPMVETFQNALKSNGGWLTLVDRAQSQPDRIERFLMAEDRLRALMPADVQSAAARWLVPEKRLEVLVLPEGTPAPD
ncbi:peptidase M16 [Novosphingobium marinum]|uniref:Zinc protease n=1 Tax=Novosphingobium marinum TaxID=1514948 RepID=A0A7Z0BWR6_9SPHN|nr:insulinase family protein [Novosphingobium marinum]NYH96547.1 zinc protease [Novosphingobium marinum]GGC36090.1 peptidase M16 [Novosphingobium marinum]